MITDKPKDNSAEELKTREATRRGTVHPATSLDARRNGFGIGGGYEKPRSKRLESKTSSVYGPVPHSGYYGSGSAARRFSIGQAGFTAEAPWFESQFGVNTSGDKKDR